MKRILSILLVAVILAAYIPTMVAYAVGSGTDDDPYIIYDGNGFNDIRNKPDAVYMIANDIVLPSDYIPFEFSGKLIGADKFNLISITTSVNLPSSTREEPAGGLFTTISGAVQISNIRLKGSVTGGDSIGGFTGSVGAVSVGAIIRNCVNEAEIKGKNYIGGFIGVSANSTLVVTNVTNEGKVSGGTSVGGISGTISKINLAVNNADVSGGSYVGGITGILYAEASDCINNGNITGTQGIGGIVGTPSGRRIISGCYNSGKITASTKNKDNSSAGIVGGAMNASAGATLTSCYSEGEIVNGAGLFNPIVTSTDMTAPGALVASDCYYISSLLEDDNAEGTTAEKDNNGKTGSFIKELNNKLEISNKYNNPDLEKEVLSKLGNSLTLFIGSSTAYVKKGLDFKALKIDDKNLDVVPVITEGRTLVPARFIAENIGASVKWDESSKTVTVNKDGTIIKMIIGNNKMYVNGVETILDVPAKIINSRTFVPLRAIANAMGKSVFWDDRGLIAIRDGGSAPTTAAVNEAVKLWLTSSFDELCAKVSSAEPGDDIVLANGVYNNIVGVIEAKGTPDKNIIVRAQTPGGVVFTEKVDITIKGDHITFKDFRIENVRTNSSVIKLNRATECRVTECYFYNIFGATTTFLSCVNASNISQRNRVDHNTFETTAGAFGVTLDFYEDTLNFDNRVDHNYMKDVPWVSDIFPGQLNGFEQIGAGAAKIDELQTPRLIVEDNLFENIDGDRSEVICIKSSENIIRYNTFLNCRLSGPDFRLGHRCTFSGNYAINSRIGMRFYGFDHKIENNYFYGCQRTIEMVTGNDGDIFQEGSQYFTIRNATVKGNVIIYPSICGIKLGAGFNPLSNYLDIPDNAAIKDNLFVVDRGPAILHSISTYDDFSNNVVSVSGSGEIGTTAEGFEEKNIELEFDGEIYVPKGVKLDKRGLKSYKEVGPTNRYWESLLKNPADDIVESVKEPDATPESYKPSKNELVLIKGESYDLSNLSGTAEYENYSYNALSFNIDYAVKDMNVANINGNILTATNVGNTDIIATYKTLETPIKLIVAEPSVIENKSEMYSNGFDSDKSVEYFKDSAGVWKVENGKLTNSGISTMASRMIIDNSSYVKGDFSISCDLTAKTFNPNDTGNVDGSIIIGYKENMQPEYYRVGFGSLNGTNTNIFEKVNDTVSNAVGIVDTRIVKDQTHKIKVTKIKDKLIAYVDGEITGIADIPENLEGRIGFASNKVAEFDNVVIEKATSGDSHSVSDISINIERTDVEEVVLNFDKVADAVYRVYKDDLWIYDTTDLKYVDDRVKADRDYHYVVKAFNKSGQMIAQGEATYRLPEEMDPDMFVISNCMVRLGWNASFSENMYKVRNKGLSAKQRIYCDRVYTWGDIIPPEFENAPYIMTRNSDITLPLMQSAKTEDFIKFDINKSAIVYLLVQPNKSKVEPEWLAANGWEIVPEKMFGENWSLIYKKHYEVENGKATVTIGGREGKLPSMYSIVFKVD